MDFYIYAKALHIVGFVTWFAGLFYLVRMFVYFAEVDQKPAALQADWKAQFTLMQKRVYQIICTPALYFTWTFGLTMIFLNPIILEQTWIQVKLVLLLILVAYHFYCKTIIRRQESGEMVYSSFQFRLLNEFPTLFLVAIVFLAVLRDFQNFLALFGGVIAFGVMLYFFAKAYKRSREKNGG